MALTSGSAGSDDHSGMDAATELVDALGIAGAEDKEEGHLLWAMVDEFRIVRVGQRLVFAELHGVEVSVSR